MSFLTPLYLDHRPRARLTFFWIFTTRRWVLDAGRDVSKYIALHFTSLDIQSSSNTGTSCAVAYVEIRDYPLGELVWPPSLTNLTFLKHTQRYAFRWGSELFPSRFCHFQVDAYVAGDSGQVRRYCGSDLPEDFVSFEQVLQVCRSCSLLLVLYFKL